MKIFLTGATGYIGKRLLPLLVSQGHQVVCGVRDPSRFQPPDSMKANISVVTTDLLDAATLTNIPDDIDAAYYLIHSMSSSNNYQTLEQQCAINFRERISKTKAIQVIFLSGIINGKALSDHLLSRKKVEEELLSGPYALTTLRAGIIVGSGSASFEIIRDLVEKLPVMVTPKWLLTRCQPIGISDVLLFLLKSLHHPETYNRDFDIGGPDILTYKNMLLAFARVSYLGRVIWTVPVMTPKLSSYWLYFVTSTSYRLASSLVDSMKVEVVCRNNDINTILEVEPIPYEEAIKRAFTKIKNNEIVSSWKDSYASSGIEIKIADFISVPTFGCFVDQRRSTMDDRLKTLDRVWQIGGKNGWYYAHWLWALRGYLDKLFGGVGLRRGRTNPNEIAPGDSLDFWRVLYANKKEGRLLLIAEMKLPGEAWLEFRVENDQLVQTATFRPLGVAGRMYWYSVYVFHGFIFSGLLNKLTTRQDEV